MLRRVLGIAIVAASLASNGCGSKSGGSSITGPSGTPTDPTAVALTAAILPLQNNLIAPNAAIFASAGAMGSFIPGVLAGPPPNGRPSGEPSECIPAQLNGVTFDFNGSGYVATELPGAPVDGPRFLLYPLNAQGMPMLGTPSGHLDLTCQSGTSVAPNARFYSITLFASSTVIMTAQAEVDLGNTVLTGTLSNPSGSTTVPFTSQLYEPSLGQEYQTLFLGPSFGLEILHRRTTNTNNGTVDDGFNVRPEGSLPAWIADVDIRANLARTVSNGGLLVSGPQLQNALAACISGTLGAPVFSPQQTAGCNFTPNGGTIQITNADASTYQDVYRNGRRVFDVVLALARTVHQPLPPL